MPTPRLTPEILSAAIDGFEAQKAQIDIQIAELRAMLPGAAKPTVADAPAVPARKRKKFSAATRLRMKQAQQLRWARIKGEAEPAAPPAPPKTEKPKAKRQISPEGIARIIAATKKRWAAKRAAEKASAKKAPTKTAGSTKATKKTARAVEQAAG